MSTINKIFLDLDDVLNTFTLTALQHVGCTIKHYEQYPRELGFDIVAGANKLLGRRQFTADSFWRCIPRSLWATCPPSDICYRLVDLAERAVGRDNVRILTAPASCPDSLAGKQEWAYRYLPPWLHDRVITCKTKSDCARPGALLIDDAEHNIIPFAAAGGVAWLVPRPWNRFAGKQALRMLEQQFATLDRSGFDCHRLQDLGLVPA